MITVWCLYRALTPRGYAQRDRTRVFDTEAEAEAMRGAMERREFTFQPHLRHYLFVAPQQCVARLWLLMYQECYEGAVVVGVYRSKEAAEQALEDARDHPEPLLGPGADHTDLFIEEDLLL